MKKVPPKEPSAPPTPKAPVPPSPKAQANQPEEQKVATSLADQLAEKQGLKRELTDIPEENEDGTEAPAIKKTTTQVIASAKVQAAQGAKPQDRKMSNVDALQAQLAARLAAMGGGRKKKGSDSENSSSSDESD